MNAKISKWLFLHPVHFIRGENLYFHIRNVEQVSGMIDKDYELYLKNCLKNILGIASRDYDYIENYIYENKQLLCDCNNIEVLKNIPFSTKKIINNYLARDVFPSFLYDRRSTSGSTGSPFVHYKDRFATGYMEAVQRHALSWYGLEVGSRQAFFWGNSSGGNYKENIKDFLKNRKRMSAFDLTEESMTVYSEMLLSFKPDYFYGYGSVVAEYVDYLLLNKRYTQIFNNLKLIVTTGEYIDSGVLSSINLKTGVPVASEYGCSEVGVIGFACPYGNMHVMNSNIYFETINSSGESVVDQEGEVVVTELHAKKYPLVRYKTGDRAILKNEKCPCGRASETFDLVAGRIVDFVLTPSGKKISSRCFKYTLKKGVKKFMAIQKKLDLIDISIVVNDEYINDFSNEYKSTFNDLFGDSMTINIGIVEHIERQPSGKYKDFIREFEI